MQREPFDIVGAPVAPLRAEPRPGSTGDSQHRIRGVRASSGGLLRATVGSALAAGAILIFAWLPAEYGIDPTGVGGLLGLTEMGEIKQQLYAEAAADDAALSAQAVVATAVPAPPNPALTERLDVIEEQLAAIAAIVGAVPVLEPSPVPQVAEEVPEAASAPVAVSTPVEPAAPLWRDEVSYTLAPTEGIEIKLVMDEGARAEFEWSANGAVLNHDTHGDGSGQRITYEQGRAVPGQEGELVAAFAGNHGWFWRNRTDAPVTFTLRTRGDYAEVKAP